MAVLRRLRAKNAISLHSEKRSKERTPDCGAAKMPNLTHKMNIELEGKPEDWRKGQTIFNFLEFLRRKGYGSEQSARMADPFYIPDDELEELYEEYLAYLKSPNPT
jgi:hypothetical protein